MDKLWSTVFCLVTVLYVASANSTTLSTTAVHMMTSTTTVLHTSTLAPGPSSTHTTSVSLTPTQTTSPTQSSASHGPNVTPHPSPESGPSLNEYIIETVDIRRNNKSNVCLRLDSMIVLMFTYKTTDDKENTTVIPFGDTAAVDHKTSSCHLSICAEPTAANLVVTYTDKDRPFPYMLTLTFNETEDNKHWEFGRLTVNYTINSVDFPNYKYFSQWNGKPVSVSTNESLFDWTTPNVKLSDSYRCLSNTTLSRFSNNKNMQSDDAISVSVSFSNLQVQAFKFNNNETKFDRDHSCYADRHIAVPVAVAVALTLLTCAVLTLSLIKMCWRKQKERKSSSKNYHRLSTQVDPGHDH